MGFHILGKDGESIIKDLNTWKKYGPPTSSNHWAEGRSAMEFARAWINNGPAVPQDIKRIFKSSLDMIYHLFMLMLNGKLHFQIRQKVPATMICC